MSKTYKVLLYLVAATTCSYLTYFCSTTIDSPENELAQRHAGQLSSKFFASLVIFFIYLAIEEVIKKDKIKTPI